MKKKTMLEMQLKRAQEESSLLSGRLTVQKKKYTSLQGTFLESKKKLIREHTETMNAEYLKTKELKDDYEASIKNCDKMFQEAITESKKIRTQLNFKIKIFGELKNKKVKRAKWAVFINEAEKEFAFHAKNVDTLEFEKRRVCDIAGTPGPELRKRCEKLAAEIASMRTKDKSFEDKIATLHKQYDAL